MAAAQYTPLPQRTARRPMRRGDRQADEAEGAPPAERAERQPSAGEACQPAVRSVPAQADCQRQCFRVPAVEGHAFEWGQTLEEAIAETGLAMYNYMTPISAFVGHEATSREFEAEGHDMHSLLFAFLDELLFVFHTEFLVCCELTVTLLDRKGWMLKAIGRGGKFDRQEHVVGTEVKAITYSAMHVSETQDDAEVFVIVDI